MYSGCSECEKIGKTCSGCWWSNWFCCCFVFSFFGGLISMSIKHASDVGGDCSGHWPYLFIPLGLYLAGTIFYFVFKNIKNIYNTTKGLIPAQISRCLVSIKYCKNIPGIDEETVNRLFVLGQQIKKYSNDLLKEIKTLEFVMAGINGDKAKDNLKDIIKQRKDSLNRLVGVLEDLIPSVVNGNYNEHIVNVEEDLKRAKTILEKTNKELSCLK